MKIGVIGNGFVGKATSILECKDIELLCYDINPELCKPKGLEMKDIIESDIIFISVPTPMNKDGSCHIGILESVIKSIQQYKDLDDLIVVIRSTVPPGTADKLNCYFMPEFLTEKNYINDFKYNKEWIFGLKNKEQDKEFKKVMEELINLAYNNNRIFYDTCKFLPNKDAEMLKLFRNIFLACKVAFCNEIYEFCNKNDINYSRMVNLACNDERIGQSHNKVPGHDGRKGFGGTCFPKDINNLSFEMKKLGMESIIIDNVIKRNLKDRPEKDWEGDVGRAVI